MEEYSKERSAWRSFLSYFQTQVPDTSERKVLYGTPEESDPERFEGILSSDIKEIIVLRDDRYAGGRGEEPHVFSVHLFIKATSDIFGVRAENLRDLVRNVFNGPVQMYNFSDRSAPVIIASSYLHAVYESSRRVPSNYDGLIQWEMLFNVYVNRADSRYDV